MQLSTLFCARQSGKTELPSRELAPGDAIVTATAAMWRIAGASRVGKFSSDAYIRMHREAFSGLFFRPALESTLSLCGLRSHKELNVA